MVATHCYCPFHLLERWNGECFERTTLADLGLVIHLGHSGEPCPAISHDKRDKNTSTITVIHLTGIQDVKVEYCQCMEAPSYCMQPRPLQLLSVRLWPSTYERIQGAFTLDVLEFFQQLTLQSKISAYDFMGTLRRLTDDAFGETYMVRTLLRYAFLQLKYVRSRADTAISCELFAIMGIWRC